MTAEVESLEKDRVRLGGLQWMLDPDLVPEGLFRLGLSPYSDLLVRHQGAKGQVVVEAVLAPDADCGALGRCLARLVDPTVRRVLAQAAFAKAAPDRVRAELQLEFTLDELPESWIEVVQDELWPSPQRQATPDQARPALGRRGPPRRTCPGRACPALG